MSAVDSDSSDCLELLLHNKISASTDDGNKDNFLCRAIKREKT